MKWFCFAEAMRARLPLTPSFAEAHVGPLPQGERGCNMAKDTGTLKREVQQRHAEA